MRVIGNSKGKKGRGVSKAKFSMATVNQIWSFQSYGGRVSKKTLCREG